MRNPADLKYIISSLFTKLEGEGVPSTAYTSLHNPYLIRGAGLKWSGGWAGLIPHGSALREDGRVNCPVYGLDMDFHAKGALLVQSAARLIYLKDDVFYPLNIFLYGALMSLFEEHIK